AGPLGPITDNRGDRDPILVEATLDPAAAQHGAVALPGDPISGDCVDNLAYVERALAGVPHAVASFPGVEAKQAAAGVDGARAGHILHHIGSVDALSLESAGATLRDATLQFVIEQAQDRAAEGGVIAGGI